MVKNTNITKLGEKYKSNWIMITEKITWLLQLKFKCRLKNKKYHTTKLINIETGRGGQKANFS